MELFEIIDSVDILEYVSQFCELTQRSDGQFWGLSPLKDENTPSFSLNQELQRFYDFSSGKGGNVLEFIKEYHHCDIYKAINILKEFAGVTDEIESGRPKRMLSTSICKKYREIKRPIKENKATILSDDVMNMYDDNESKLKLWTDEGISVETLRKFQVKYDKFSDSIVYPITNCDGKIVNIGARTLDPLFKEHNKKKYMYFYPWGQMSAIYGLSENMEYIKDKKEIILFEGCKSVLKAHSWGIYNAGAILTSHLSPLQAKILIQLGCNVVFALDKEINIRQDHNIEKLKPYINVYTYYDYKGLLEAKDSPVDKGKEVWEVLYKEKIRLR